MPKPNPIEMDMVTFDRPKLIRLNTAIAAAEAEGKETFVFDGKDYFVQYAKYLAEYVNGWLTGRGV